MGFALFDLPSTIRAHNALHPETRLSESETFGLSVFSSDRQKFMEQGFYLYDNVYYEKKGFNPPSVKSYQTVLENIKKLSAHASIPKIRQLVDSRLKDKQMTEAFLEREEKSKALKLDVTFTHYHCSAILQAFKYLRVIERSLLHDKSVIEKARKSVSRKIPTDIFLEMWGYVNVQLSLVQEQTKRLTEGMVERLILACEEGSLAQADVLSETVKRYREEGVVSPDYTVPSMPTDKITPELFQSYHEAIVTYGDETTRAKLFQLPWLDPNSAHLTIKEQVASRLGVLEDIPKQLRSPRFLFLGHNLRYEWFNSFYFFYSVARIETHLRMTERVLEGAPDQVTEFELNCADAQADIIRSLIEEEKQRCEKCLERLNTWWRRPFHQRTLNFINKVFQELDKKERQLLQQKSRLRQKHEEILSNVQRVELEHKLFLNIRPEFLSLPFFENAKYPKDADIQALVTYCKGLNPNHYMDKNFLGVVSTIIDETLEGFRRKCIPENIPPEAIQCYVKLVEALGNQSQRRILAEHYDALQNEVEQDIKELDKQLVEYLFSIKKFGLTDTSKEYWMMRRKEMIEKNIPNIVDLPGFNFSDETFFGIRKEAEENSQKNPRELMGFLINFTTALYLDLKKLSKIHDPEIKMQKIGELKTQWLHNSEGMNDKALEAVFTGYWVNDNQMRRGVSL